MITHTNGSAVYERVKNSIKEEVEKKYYIPKNEPYLYLDKDRRPFVQRPNEAKFYCSMKSNSTYDSFHNYSNRQD